MPLQAGLEVSIVGLKKSVQITADDAKSRKRIQLRLLPVVWITRLDEPAATVYVHPRERETRPLVALWRDCCDCPPEAKV